MSGTYISNGFIHAEMISEKYLVEIKRLNSVLNTGDVELCCQSISGLLDQMRVSLAYSELKSNGVKVIN